MREVHMITWYTIPCKRSFHRQSTICLIRNALALDMEPFVTVVTFEKAIKHLQNAENVQFFKRRSRTTDAAVMSVQKETNWAFKVLQDYFPLFQRWQELLIQKYRNKRSDFSSRRERICKWIPISSSLGEETALENVSISKEGLKCQRVMLSDMPNWGDMVICWYTGCTLQTFIKHYDSTISPPFFQRFPL